MTATQPDEQLRQFIADRARAVANRDAHVLVDAYSVDVVSFPLLPPAETHGTHDIAHALSTWFDSYVEGPAYDVHNLHVQAADDLGYCCFRYHVTGVLKDGATVDMWVRSTLVCRREDGRWRVVHAHESVPFDPRTAEGLISLGPESDA
jgi:uncharacterized protein (TIGR02246 family)